ncbi:MAG: hypothetical protein ACLFQB_16050 [Chitinispirillaceae bacterium]
MRMKLFFSFIMFLLLSLSAVPEVNAADPAGSDQDSLALKKGTNESSSKPAFKPQPYSPKRDMAFVSIMGSRPQGSFEGFQRAVLYNAKGAVIKEVDISRSDSIYSLDKMIQENRNKGPLFIKMFR